MFNIAHSLSAAGTASPDQIAHSIPANLADGSLYNPGAKPSFKWSLFSYTLSEENETVGLKNIVVDQLGCNIVIKSVFEITM